MQINLYLEKIFCKPYPSIWNTELNGKTFPTKVFSIWTKEKDCNINSRKRKSIVIHAQLILKYDACVKKRAVLQIKTNWWMKK